MLEAAQSDAEAPRAASAAPTVRQVAHRAAMLRHLRMLLQGETPPYRTMT
jgi:hypothetical protein